MADKVFKEMKLAQACDLFTVENSAHSRLVFILVASPSSVTIIVIIIVIAIVTFTISFTANHEFLIMQIWKSPVSVSFSLSLVSFMLFSVIALFHCLCFTPLILLVSFLHYFCCFREDTTYAASLLVVIQRKCDVIRTCIRLWIIPLKPWECVSAFLQGKKKHVKKQCQLQCVHVYIYIRLKQNLSFHLILCCNSQMFIIDYLCFALVA